jgi:signal transduction histidine kinase
MAILSHELRSPLSTLTMNYELLERSTAGAGATAVNPEKLIHIGARQVERMRRLIEGLLDVNRLATDRMAYEKSPVSLSAVLAGAMERVASELQARHASVPLDVEPELVGEWDRDRIEQVFTNLIANALKHGGPPFSITARRKGQVARIVVQDHGPGIPAQDVERILKPFERGKAGHAEGLGLGLHIAQSIVKAHQGTLRVESEVGKGTSFMVELPILP